MPSISTRLATEQERLGRYTREGKIWVRDAAVISRFVANEMSVGKADSTVFQYGTRLRTLSKRASKPFVDMSGEEMQSLLSSMESGEHPDVKDDGIDASQYQKVLQRLRHHTELGYDVDELDVSASSGRNLSPNDLLFQQDVDDLLNACGTDTRYKALITWALASGQRLDAIRTVRLKHISWDGAVGEIQLNEEEGALKGQSGSIPMFWAKHYVRQWLFDHPYTDSEGRPEDHDAGLFCPDPRMQDPAGRTDPRSPLQQATIRSRLRTFRDRAGLDKHVYPHLFRHCAGTRMVLNGLSEQKIKSVMGWAGESGQFNTYVTLADQLRNDSLRADMGLPTSDSGHPTIGKPTLDKCGACGEEWPPRLGDKCPTCGGEASDSLAEIIDEHGTEKVLETIAEKEGLSLE